MNNIEPFYQVPGFTFYLGDNMHIMSAFKKKEFDLILADPPYGIGESMKKRTNFSVKQKNGSILKVKENCYTPKQWDKTVANKEYFFELIRISKDQIIFGANYYEFDLLGFINTKTPRRIEYDSFIKNRPYGYIIWDKINGNNDFNDCEIIYTSKTQKTKIVYYMWNGMFQGLVASEDYVVANRQIGNKKLNEKRIHPTQKPVILYSYLLDAYAKQNMKILDPNLGSGSSAIAIDIANKTNEMQIEFVAIEKDKDHLMDAVDRFKTHQAEYNKKLIYHTEQIELF